MYKNNYVFVFAIISCTYFGETDISQWTDKSVRPDKRPFPVSLRSSDFTLFKVENKRSTSVVDTGSVAKTCNR